MEPLAVDLDEGARLVGLSKHTLRAYVRRGVLNATRCGRRIILQVEELRRLVREGVPPKSERAQVALDEPCRTKRDSC
jgi:excisionase family DNA binding protein